MNINKLVDLMKINKINQRELAKLINQSQTALSQSIQRQDLKISTLEKIAAALNVPVSYFFDEDNKGNNNIIVKNNNGHNNNVNISHNSNDLQKIEMLEKRIKDLEKIIELLEK